MGTFAGSKLSIGTTLAVDWSTPSAALASFEADTYIPVGGLSNMGEFGAAASVLTFPLVTDNYVKKSKGTRDAGDPAVVVERESVDPGQVALRAGEKTKYYYNFRLELDDAVDANHSNTVFYFRAIIAGVPNQFGGNEDFVTETYNLGVYPGPLIVESEETGGGGVVAPENTALPSIAGTAEEGETLTLNAGTWTGAPVPTLTRQWFADGESLAGQTGPTLVLTGDHVGKVIAALVTATNAGGFAHALAPATSAVAP